MGHLEDCWLGPVLCLTCGLWPSFQIVSKKENRMRKPFDSAHLCVWLKERQRGKSRLVERKISLLCLLCLIHGLMFSTWNAKQMFNTHFHTTLNIFFIFLWRYHFYRQRALQRGFSYSRKSSFVPKSHFYKEIYHNLKVPLNLKLCHPLTSIFYILQF